MTKAQSTSKSRASRNRGAFLTRLAAKREGATPVLGAKSRLRAARRAAGLDTEPHSLDEVLKRGRERLADAESVLGCLHIALLYAEDCSVREDPDYASAAAIALSLVREVAQRLDAASVKPMVDALGKRLVLGKAVRR